MSGYAGHGNRVRIEVDVKIEGFPVEIKTLGDWERINSLVRDSFSQSSTISVPPMHAFTTEVSTQSDIPLRFDWTHRAWFSIGRPATASQLYEAAVKLGYNPVATDPKGAFIKAVRDNPRLHSIGRGPGGVLWGLDTTGLITPDDRTTDQTESTSCSAERQEDVFELDTEKP